MRWHKDTRSDACEHTPNASSRLKAFPPPCLFIQRCDILPWHVIKKRPRFWGSDSHCLQMSSGDRSRRGCRMMSWWWVMRVNLAPWVGWGGGRRRGGGGGCSLLRALPWLPREGRVASPPLDTRWQHSIPLSGSANPLSWLNQLWPTFCFLVLLYFSTSVVGVTEASRTTCVSECTRKTFQFFSPLHLCHTELWRFPMQVTGTCFYYKLCPGTKVSK